MAENNEKEKELYTPIFDVLIQKYKNLDTAAVYGAYWRWCQWSPTNICIQSYADIGAQIGLNWRTVQRRFKILVTDGYLLDLTPTRRNDPHEVKITDKMTLEARLNGHTNQTKRGKRRGKGQIGMTDSHTNDTQSELGMTDSHNAMTDSHTGYDTLSVKEDSWSTKETGGGKPKSPPPDTSLLEEKQKAAILLWREVVNPNEKGTPEIYEQLGENPDPDALRKAFEIYKRDARGKTGKNGNPWSITAPGPILERYKEIVGGNFRAITAADLGYTRAGQNNYEPSPPNEGQIRFRAGLPAWVKASSKNSVFDVSEFETFHNGKWIESTRDEAREHLEKWSEFENCSLKLSRGATEVWE